MSFFALEVEAVNPNSYIQIDAINDISGPDFALSCEENPLFSPISVEGSGYGIAPPGQIDQYAVLIDWGDGIVENSQAVFEPNEEHDDFTFSFSAGPHFYNSTGDFNVRILLYHTQPPGYDNQAEITISIPVCEEETNTPPIITLLGDNPLELTVGNIFEEPGYTAEDAEDGDLTDEVFVGGDEVDTDTAGMYVITYSVTDSDGNTAEVSRTVHVNPIPTQCSDGIDNDGDGKIDFPNDPGCENADDDDEVDPTPEPEPEPERKPDLITENLSDDAEGNIIEGQAVAFSGNVRNQGNKGIDSSNASLFERIAATEDIDGAEAFNAVVVFEDYAYVASQGSAEELLVFDLSNPQAPVQAGGFDWPGINNSASDVAVSGNYAYLLSGDLSDKFAIIDISNPTAPSLVGEAATAERGWELDVSGNFAYVVSGHFAGDDFEIFDVLDKTNPVKMGGLDFTSTQKVRDIVVAGSYAYMVSDHDNLNDDVNPPDFRIIDVSNPASPFVAGELELYPDNGACDPFCNFGPNAITLSGSYAYIGSDDALLVIDVTDPENPQEVLRIDTPRIESVQVFGDQLFALTHFNGVYVYAISNPESPVLLGQWGQSSLYGDANANRGIGIALTAAHAFIARSTTAVDTSAYVGVYQIELIARFCINGTEADCYEGSATEIALVPFDALAAGVSQEVSAGWTAGGAGDYTLYLCADVNGPAGAVSESDETNNCSSMLFAVTALADMNTQPVITLLGYAEIDLIIEDTFTDPGATAADAEDGDLTDDIVVGGDTVDTNIVGTYTITYNVTDSEGLAAEEVTRTVHVNPEVTECNDSIDNDGDGKIDFPDDPGCTSEADNDENEKPTITLLGDNPINLTVGDAFTDPGAVATDPEDGDITDDIVIGGDEVSTTTPGTYTITYNVTDSEGLAAIEVIRTVNVNEPEPLPQCSDGIDNDGDGKIDFPDDPGCENADDNNETDPAPEPEPESEPEPEPTPSGGGGGGGGGGGTIISGPLSIGYQAPGGQVAGAIAAAIPVPQPQPAPGECAQYLFGFIKEGQENDPVEVRKLQSFLRNFEGFANVQVTGVYDKVTQDAVDVFQEKYFDDVLAPWGHDKATTYVYLTTRKKINEIYCRGEKQFPLTAVQQEEVEEFRAWLESLKTKEPINLTSPKEEKEIGTLKEILKDSVEIEGVDKAQPAAVGVGEGTDLLQGAIDSVTNFLKRLKNIF